jgi:squalene cyclase
MPEMGLETAITANAYFNRKNVKRCLRRLFVAIPDLNNWQRFFTQMDKSFEGDGFILIVPVIQGTTAVADNYVKAYSSYDTPYRDLIVVGITTYTLDFLTVLQRHAALKQLKINKESIYGLNGEQEDVWETLMDECEISIKRELRQMVAVQHRRIQYFWRGEKQAIASENLLADEVMQYCYPKTRK